MEESREGRRGSATEGARSSARNGQPKKWFKGGFEEGRRRERRGRRQQREGSREDAKERRHDGARSQRGGRRERQQKEFKKDTKKDPINIYDLKIC